jgi:hypothetical protein
VQLITEIYFLNTKVFIMKKEMLLALSVLLFAGLMWYNLQQVNSHGESVIPNITKLELEMTPTIALAESCGYWDNGEIVIQCGQSSGCCYFCSYYTQCLWTGSPTDYCEMIGELCW